MRIPHLQPAHVHAGTRSVAHSGPLQVDPPWAEGPSAWVLRPTRRISVLVVADAETHRDFRGPRGGTFGSRGGAPSRGSFEHWISCIKEVDLMGEGHEFRWGGVAGIGAVVLAIIAFLIIGSPPAIGTPTRRRS